MSAERCAVVDLAKHKAQDRGLDARIVSCPLLSANACDGLTCIFAPLKEVMEFASQADKFFKKLEEHGKAASK